MAYKITDDCITCGACQSECEVDAITEGDDCYVIDAAKCDDCDKCIEACPADAIVKI